VKLIEDIFIKPRDIKITEQSINPNIFPYYLFTLVFGKGKMDYTSFRSETINFNQINKEASVYYNYARFTLEDDFLCIYLMQTKIGGMPIDEDIVKFTKRIPIKSSGLEEFINKNRDISSETLKKIRKEIDNIL
jgi:hypothetical protein